MISEEKFRNLFNEKLEDVRESISYYFENGPNIASENLSYSLGSLFSLLELVEDDFRKFFTEEDEKEIEAAIEKIDERWMKNVHNTK